MLAGTVLTDRSMFEMKVLLANHEIRTRISEDELELEGRVNLTFRTGFDHEYIIVGDAVEPQPLLDESERLSSILRQHQIQHAFEIYDHQNRQVFEVDYQG